MRLMQRRLLLQRTLNSPLRCVRYVTVELCNNINVFYKEAVNVAYESHLKEGLRFERNLNFANFVWVLEQS